MSQSQSQCKKNLFTEIIEFRDAFEAITIRKHRICGSVLEDLFVTFIIYLLNT